MKKIVFSLIFVVGLAFAQPRFTDLGNGIIKDNATKLLWQKCSAGQSGSDCYTGFTETKKWGDAKSYCTHLKLGGKTNWRLPEKKELLTLLDYTKIYMATNMDFFPNGDSSYWSNTIYAGDSDLSWAVYFSEGASDTTFHIDEHAVRCVANP